MAATENIQKHISSKCSDTIYRLSGTPYFQTDDGKAHLETGMSLEGQVQAIFAKCHEFLVKADEYNVVADMLGKEKVETSNEALSEVNWHRQI